MNPTIFNFHAILDEFLSKLAASQAVFNETWQVFTQADTVEAQYLALQKFERLADSLKEEINRDHAPELHKHCRAFILRVRYQLRHRTLDNKALTLRYKAFMQVIEAIFTEIKVFMQQTVDCENMD